MIKEPRTKFYIQIGKNKKKICTAFVVFALGLVFACGTTEPEPIDPPTEYDYSPIWHPSGEFIAFGRRYADYYTQIDSGGIWAVDVDGENQRIFITSRAIGNNVTVNMNAFWHPDGEKMLFSGFGFVDTISFSNPWIPSNIDIWQECGSSVTDISSDGNIVCARIDNDCCDRGLYLHILDEGRSIYLGYNLWYGNISPDCNEVVAKYTEGDSTSLVIMDTLGNIVRVIDKFRIGSKSLGRGYFSPDGNTIAHFVGDYINNLYCPPKVKGKLRESFC